jgi:hypothetical protein
MRRALIFAFTVMAVSASAWAQSAVNNPIVEAYGEIAIAGVEVRYRDGVLPRHQDSAASNYAARRFDDVRRTEFEALAQPRGLSEETAAERFGEYLAERDLRARGAAMQGRRVNVAVTVIDANAPSMISVLVPGARIIPTLTYEFAITDAESGAPLANGRVDDLYSLAHNINDARRRNELEYNFSGSDQNFRTMAGQANALAESVMSLVTASAIVSGGRSSIGTAYAAGAPMNVTAANAQYMIRVTPPPAPIESASPATAEQAPPTGQ